MNRRINRIAVAAKFYGRVIHPGLCWRQPRAVVSLSIMMTMVSFLALGCEKVAPRGSRGSPTTSRAIVVDTEPGEVLLKDATAIVNEQGILRFQIDYEFTSGKPSKFYICEITFPGTSQLRVKSFSPGELKSEGTITTAFETGEAPMETFSMTLSEADSPHLGYDKISNTLTGTVERTNKVQEEDM